MRMGVVAPEPQEPLCATDGSTVDENHKSADDRTSDVLYRGRTVGLDADGQRPSPKSRYLPRFSSSLW